MKPTQFVTNGRTLNFAGPSRTPGGLLYVDHAVGMLIELFVAVITRTGYHFSTARIEANPDLGTVKIEAAAFAGRPALIGGTYLIGPLTFDPRPRAQFAYPLNGAVRPGGTQSRIPQVRRETGTFVDVSDRGWGRLRSDNGNTLFAHASSLEHGAQLVVGLRVTFETHQSPKGAVARAIRPAAN